MGPAYHKGVPLLEVPGITLDPVTVWDRSIYECNQVSIENYTHANERMSAENYPPEN